MEGSVLSVLKAEWKVSDTAHWASSFHLNFAAVFSLNWWQELVLVVFQWISSISYGFDKFILNMTVFFLLFYNEKENVTHHLRLSKIYCFYSWQYYFFRPSAAALLNHSFFKHLKKRSCDFLPTLLQPVQPLTINMLQKGRFASYRIFRKIGNTIKCFLHLRVI